MKIRSVTCFVNADETPGVGGLAAAGALVRAARQAVPRAGYELQTARLAVPPLAQTIPDGSPVEWAVRLAARASEVGLDYAALLVENEAWFDQVPGMIARAENLFVSIRIASRQEGLDLAGVRAAARVIRELAKTTADGLGNFRFAAAANCPPGVPFFPVAFASPADAGSFAFAAEAGDLAVQAVAASTTLEEARGELVGQLEAHGRRLEELGTELSRASGLRFAGIDLSLAPYPEPDRSLGTAVEGLIGGRFGTRGTLFAAAFLTDCLRRAQWRRAGFSGLMLPVLEDWTLAARSTENLYSLDSLLLYSTVCGTGLDTIPLAGDTTEAALAALLLDLGALAVKLDKPLTARLIPVPGLNTGERTRFSFEYFANARAFDIVADGWLRVFESSRRIPL